MKLEERLNEIIEEKEDKIDDLKNELGQLKSNQDLEQLKWQLHEYYEETEFDKQMPYPRLEMRFKRLPSRIDDDECQWYRVAWHYGIVYKHFAETSNKALLFIPLGYTTSSNSNGRFESYFRNNKLDTPIRDGVHIFSESKLFNIPAFIVCEEKGIIQKINIDTDITDQLSKMIRK